MKIKDERQCIPGALNVRQLRRGLVYYTTPTKGYTSECQYHMLVGHDWGLMLNLGTGTSWTADANKLFYEVEAHLVLGP